MIQRKNCLFPSHVALGCVLIVFASSNASSMGASVKLAWDASPDPTVEGYFLYHQRSDIPGEAGLTRIDAEDQTEHVAISLQPGATYTFYVTAYNFVEDESEPSNEIVYTVPNEAPTAHAKNISLEGTGLSHPLTLSGADPEGFPLTYRIVTNPAKGQLQGTLPNLTYIASHRMNDTDQFVYVVSDGFSESAPVAVDIQLSLNKIPTATDDTITRKLAPTIKFNIGDILQNDQDADNDPLTITEIDATTLKGGTVTRQGSWVYFVPAVGTQIIDQFTYTVGDSIGGFSTARVTILFQGSSQFRSLTPSITEANTVLLKSIGIPGRSYIFEVSSDLVTWTPLETVTADSSGLVVFEDTDPSHVGSRFYRMIEP